MADPIRLIKKYPNRRLYDTKTSAYITLGDVKTMVVAGDAFCVVDAKNGTDLTRSILLQIVLEEETHAAAPLFRSEMLISLIRCYGAGGQGALGQCLEMTTKSFAEVHKKLSEPAHPLIGENGVRKEGESWPLLAAALQSALAAAVEASRKTSAAGDPAKSPA